MCLNHKTSAGVTTSAPPKSPSHHVGHTVPKLAVVVCPKTHNDPTPMVALIGVATSKLITANRATPAGLSKVAAPSDHRVTAKPSATASSVLPVPIASEDSTKPDVVTLARKAARKSAGQTRSPNSKTAAKAKPVAGHTGLALGWMTASNNPSFARTK